MKAVWNTYLTFGVSAVTREPMERGIERGMHRMHV
jgi:hypothetical protein